MTGFAENCDFYHMVYSASRITEIIGAANTLSNAHAPVSVLLTDSRQLSQPAETLFFALGGKRDGHEFIAALYKAGVRNFVVQKKQAADYGDANFFVVPDVLSALQKLVAQHRAGFDYDVIGITGSNGKTIVKEWLYQLLAADKRIVRNPRSYNSQTGVPLAVWAMDAHFDLGIFEAGISKPAEMEKLRQVIQPTIGILTHIGPAHAEGFDTENQKIAEKLMLFKDVGLFVFHDEDLRNYAGKIPGKRSFRIGKHEADLQIIGIENDNQHTRIDALFAGENVWVKVPYTDAASLKNLLTCWATLLAMGYEQQIIGRRMEKLMPVSMRLQLKNGLNNCSIIDDTYNSDMQSLQIALQFLQQQNQHSTRMLILSDIFQTGLNADQLYTQVAAMVKSKVQKFIGVGPQLSAYRHLFGASDAFYPSTEALLQNLADLNIREATVLIKGSRLFGFERVSRALEQKAHETVLEINLNALQHNLDFYRSKLKPGVKIMAMVKAFSYGSGSFEIANLLQYNHVDYLAVAYADEGIALRQSGLSLPIVVLNPGDDHFEKLTEHQLEPEIYSLRLLRSFIRFADAEALSNYPVHLKIDTGMKRLGFEETDLPELLLVLKGQHPLRIASVFSHLVASGNAAFDAFSRQQIGKFGKLSAQIVNALGYHPLLHINNTSAIHRFPETQFDMVRMGIGLYGIDGAFFAGENPLQTVTTLKTSISQIKEVLAGESIGYNRMGGLARGGKIATVKIGYADGYFRAFGNGRGYMLLNGKTAPTIGNISMDMCMLDITGIDAAEGDEVIVFGKDLPIEILADKISTIPYELLTGVSQRVKRVYYME